MNGLALVLILASLHPLGPSGASDMNPGVGMSAHTSPHTYFEAGVYRNSERRTSVYELGRWQDGSERLQAGIAAGFVTGYQWPVLPLVFPYGQVSLSKRVAIEIDLLPTSHPILGAQLEVKLGR